ncbi:hypothetical protein [Cohnella hashimotonis]|uniref:Uncharacterized protein n=1 Tax=Cohnella hashimotonis TaxID=2826895 RepID=A0ABT6TRW2_9BACL|nr:hypothetical protein [Cohnella hashimotonis]MDI4649582.1 hypothetical protein [Cohnella hashimotonis]
MGQLGNNLYKSTGLWLGNVAYTHEQAIEAMLKSGMIIGEPLLEEVLWKFMTEDEKKHKILEYVSRIDAVGNTLFIIDVYFFPKEGRYDRQYFELINYVLSNSNAKTVKTVTYSSYNEALYSELKSNLTSLGIALSVATTDDFHDRFWISSEAKKGFILGTSLNGLGKKICLIDFLKEDDVIELLDNHQLLRCLQS